MRRDLETGRAFLIAANLGHSAASVTVPAGYAFKGVTVLDTALPDRIHEKIGDEIRLREGEGVIVLLNRDDKGQDPGEKI